MQDLAVAMLRVVLFEVLRSFRLGPAPGSPDAGTAAVITMLMDGCHEGWAVAEEWIAETG